MRTKKVEVVPYDKSWPAAFEGIMGEVRAALGPLAEAVEHVGSTAVPGMWAKPVLDIDVVIPDAACLPAVIRALEDIGYLYEGDLGIEGREAFRYEDKPGRMLHHLYVCPRGSRELERHLRFRDYLRSHPDAAEAYSRVKREGAALYPEDIDGYMRCKNGVIEKLYRDCGL